MRTLATWLALSLASLSMPALAGTYADEMGRCLVKATTVADRTALVRWLFAAGASHPEVVSIVSVSAPQREALNRDIARLLERLLTESCRTQTQEAIKYEGRNAFEAAFQVLGQVAGRELFSHPTVAGSMGEVDRYLDKQKLQSLGLQ
jgi:hypothetical protein